MIAGLGKRLSELRAARGYSQKFVGQAVGVSSAVIGHYENSTNTPSAEVMMKLAGFYGVSTDYLYGFDKNAIGIDEDYVSLKGIDPKVKASVRQLIKDVRDSTMDK